MLDAYAVNVAAKLEDGVTPALDRIIVGLERASALTTAWIGELRGVSVSMGSFAKNMEKASAASTKLVDSPGLNAAAARFDQMAFATADIAKNMEAARAAGIGMGGGPVNRLPGGAPSGGSSGNSEFKTKSGSQALAATGWAIAGGIYENARLQDTNIKAIATSQSDLQNWAIDLEHLRRRELSDAHKYAFASGGRIEPFAEAELEGARLLRTMPQAKQDEMMDTVMPYASLEAKLKGVDLPSAVEAFIGLAHQAGAYSQEKADPLFKSMVQASLTTHASLEQISRAASYALPSLHAAGANSSDVMLLVATMMQGGIMNTKSGTWLNAMAANALPNTLGSGLFSNKKQNEALHDLHLYKGNESQFYKNGSMDLMKLVAILADDRTKMKPLEFNALLRMAFGVQGARGASFFSEDTTIANLQALSQLKEKEQNPLLVENALKQMGTIAQADQVIADANITLMNASATFTGPVNWILSKMSGVAEKTAPYAEEHPLMATAGIAGGAFAGLVGAKLLWKGISGLADKLVSGLVMGLRSMMIFVVRQAALGMIGFVFDVTAMGAAITAVTAAIGLGISAILSYAAYQAYQHLSRENQDKIGGTVATMMAWMMAWAGSKDAQEALDATSKGAVNANAVSQQGFNKGKNAASRPSKPADIPAVNEDTIRKMHEAANGNKQASAQTININMDGKKIASYLIPQNMTGTSSFNTSADRPTPGMGSMGLS